MLIQRIASGDPQAGCAFIIRNGFVQQDLTASCPDRQIVTGHIMARQFILAFFIRIPAGKLQVLTHIRFFRQQDDIARLREQDDRLIRIMDRTGIGIIHITGIADHGP